MAERKGKGGAKRRLPETRNLAGTKSKDAGQKKPLKSDRAGARDRCASPCGLTLDVLAGAVEGVMIAEKESKKIRYVNESICKMLGYDAEELLKLTIRAIHPAQNLPDVLNDFDAQSRGEIPIAVSIPCLRKNGSVFWADISTVRLKFDRTPCIVGFFSDVSERKAARDAGEEAEALFSSVFNTVPDILGIQDIHHGIIRYNESGYRFLNTDAESVRGKKCYELIGRDGPCDRCATSETYLTKKPARLEKFVESLGVWLDVRSYPILDHDGNLKGIVEHLRDITREKRVEEEMVKSEKLASLAILSGGIAHDFNNLLGGIYGYLEMARTASQNPEVNGYLDSTLKTMNRARGLTQQLLTFAKGGSPVRKTASLDGFLRETTTFALSGSSISCTLDIADGLHACAFDANQMGQVIDNILINAQQAMPMGGTIFVSAGNVTIREGDVHALPAGRYVRISIRDKGVGIPSEILGRIFDPFFTTKQKGSGLGLATSYSIVKQHNGRIEVESEPGMGSTFHIFLPASEPVASASGAKPADAQQNTGRILIMDDEEVVRGMIAAMLQHHGYDTVLAAEGTQALRLFDENIVNGTPFLAVILDLTIRGGMGGKETVLEIRKRDPDIPVFVASGYAEDAVVSRPREYGFTDSIAKPFTRKALIEILCKYL